RDERHALLPEEPHDGGHLLRRSRENDDVRCGALEGVAVALVDAERVGMVDHAVVAEHGAKSGGEPCCHDAVLVAARPGVYTPVMREQEEAKQIVRSYVEAFNRGDIEALRALFAPDAVIFGVLGHGGFDNVVPIWRELHEALAMRLHVEDMV